MPQSALPVVAPFVGAWIEMKIIEKLEEELNLVAPFVGAWIEIQSAYLPL